MCPFVTRSQAEQQVTQRVSMLHVLNRGQQTSVEWRVTRSTRSQWQTYRKTVSASMISVRKYHDLSYRCCFKSTSAFCTSATKADPLLLEEVWKKEQEPTGTHLYLYCSKLTKKDRFEEESLKKDKEECKVEEDLQRSDEISKSIVSSAVQQAHGMQGESTELRIFLPSLSLTQDPAAGCHR